jgi:ATP-binding cassette subfamily F protein uup
MYVLYQNPNFLIFDEPTNDLDLPTLTVLENFLQQFQGSLIIVSHDRYFIDRVVDHVLAFEGEGKIRNFVGNFTEYREMKSQENRKALEQPVALAKTAEIAQAVPKSTSAQRKLSYKEQRELETIDKELPLLEEKRAEIMQQLTTETDYAIISKLSDELESLSAKLGELELRWLELQEI